jgi:hypothetical protein
MQNFNLKLSQRYYHIVALKGSTDLISKNILLKIKMELVEKIKYNSDCVVKLLSFTTDHQYYRGELDNSIGENSNPPYRYDIVIIEHKSVNISILCFPFKKLAVDIVTLLVSKYNILNKSNFFKVDMSNLIKSYNKHTDLYFNNNHFFLGGVFLTISGDSFLSTVKLEGDKPLESHIYKEYFKDRLKTNSCRLEKCILKCKPDLNQIDAIKAFSSIHIDKFGNYKLYMQSKGKNLLTVQASFEFLNNLNCLLETPNNPVSHILKEDL